MFAPISLLYTHLFVRFNFQLKFYSYIFFSLYLMAGFYFDGIAVISTAGEIDRCLKKVGEGVEQFEDIWQKVSKDGRRDPVVLFLES